MNTFCRKGDLIRLLTPTTSAWQGIGIVAETVYDDGDPDTVVPFYKQDQPLDDQVPSIALIGEVEVVVSTARSLIQRLADALDHYKQLLMDDRREIRALSAEARAYLLQPETPTNCIYFNTTSTKEVMRLDSRGLHYKGKFIADAGEAHQLMLAWLRRNLDGPAVPDGREPASVAYKPSDKELHDLWLELYRFHDGATSGEVATIARAALERWGSRTPAPIPLSERLPTEADCDAEGRCWWWHPESYERNACWCYSRGSGVEPLWLPRWALPVPGVEAENG